ncbi:MAG: hypothetical protein K2M27_04575 [Muribaculaceae bacterium]|nr:hypothetical protein [Muribaculaceae bacterium]
MLFSGFSRILSVVALLGVSFVPLRADDSAVCFSENFNSHGVFSRSWRTFGESKGGLVEIASDPDSVGNRYVRISSDERTAKGLARTVSGLTPGGLYRITARVRTDSVAEGRGAVLYVNPETSGDQPWNASEFVYGTTGWKTVYKDFICGPDGTADIVLALGFPWGTYNGGTSKGVACWDDVKVSATPADAVKRREGRHISLVFDADKVTISDRQLDAWLSKLDKTYESYQSLVGDAPYGGRKITILMTPGIEPGYWALAGNPILWNNHVNAGELLDKTVADDDWGFGILHEIGHTFSAGTIGKSGNWNWNDELFANFRMSYAIEKRGGRVSQRNTIYKGGKVRDYYKIFYDETLGAGKPTDNGDALHYTLLRIKDRYGWKVYEKAFRALYSLGDSDIAWNAPAFDKFMFFLSHVSKAAGEDVVATTFTDEEIRLIKEGFSD